MRRIEQTAEAEKILQERWESLVDNARTGIPYTQDLIQILQRLEVIGDATAELWRLRIEKCPGHENDPARQWCAYCGELPVNTRITEE